MLSKEQEEVIEDLILDMNKRKWESYFTRHTVNSVNGEVLYIIEISIKKGNKNDR